MQVVCLLFLVQPLVLGFNSWGQRERARCAMVGPNSRALSAQVGGLARSPGRRIPLVPLVLRLLCSGSPRAGTSRARRRSHCDAGVAAQAGQTVGCVALLSQTCSSGNPSRISQRVVGTAPGKWALGRSEALLWASRKRLEKCRDAHFHQSG